MNPKDENQLAQCEECPLKGCKYVPRYYPWEAGWESGDHRILFVGEAPGETETLTRKPFTGPAGKAHWGMLKSAGLNRDHYPHTNVAACRPPDNRKPTPLEVKCCFPRLLAEIREVQPELIVALGEPAMVSLTNGKGKITSSWGRFLDLKEAYQYECKVLIALHPSFVRRARQWIPTQVQTYEMINDFFTGNIKKEVEAQFIADPNADELAEYLSREDIIYAVDTETTGLDVLKDRILGHSFSDGETACAVYYREPIKDDPRWEVVQDFLEDPQRLKCWQNGSYDTEIARSHDIIDDGFVFDTRLAQQMLYSDLPSDLDHLRGQWTSIRPYKPTKKEMKRIAHWSKDRMLEYANWDALTTYQVMEAQQKYLGEKQLALMNDLLIPLVRAIGRIHRRGFKVDVPTLAGLYASCEPKVDAIYAEFAKLGVNPRSPQQLAKFFGLKSTAVPILERKIKRQAPKYQLMEQLLEFRKYDKLASVYLKGVYDRLVDGRIHTNFKIEGTGTGRLSSENPNLQNVPGEMKSIYVADEGYEIVEADYSQVELWVGAILAYLISGEDNMLQDLKSGMDVHFEACKLCFPHIEIKHNKRKKDFTVRQGFIAKSVVFGTFYGRTPRSIAIEFGVTETEARSWQLKILNHYPELAHYREWVEKTYRRDGFLETPFGRIRYLQDVKQGYNFPVQSTASDITLWSIVLLDQAGIEILATVHDSVIMQVPSNEFKDKVLLIQSIMERPVPELLNISFNVGYDRGPDWYNVKGFKPSEL